MCLLVRSANAYLARGYAANVYQILKDESHLKERSARDVAIQLDCPFIASPISRASRRSFGLAQKTVRDFRLGSRLRRACVTLSRTP